MDVNLDEIKPLVRSILLALGRRATEKEFNTEFYNLEGDSFHTILRKFRQTFAQFMNSMPDVCKVHWIGNEILVERVAAEETKHMDKLTIIKNKKRSKGMRGRFKPGFNRARNFPLSVGPRPVSYSTRSSSSYNKSSLVNSSKPQQIYRTSYAPPRLVQAASRPMRDPRVTSSPTTTAAKQVPVSRPSFVSSFHPVPALFTTAKTTVCYSGSRKMSPPRSVPPPAVCYPGMRQISPSRQKMLPTVCYSGSSRISPHPVPPPSSEQLAFMKHTPVQSVQPTSRFVQSHANKAGNMPVPERHSWILNKKASDNKPVHLKIDLQPKETLRVVATVDLTGDSSDEGNIGPAQAITNDPRKSRCAPQIMPAEPMSCSPNATTQTNSSLFLRKLQKMHQYKPPVPESDKLLDMRLVANGLGDYVTGQYTIPHPHLADVKFSFEVQLLEINSPRKFVFQFDLAKLTEFMGDLNFHYNNLKESTHNLLNIPKVTVGMSAAATTYGQWFRVEVLCLCGAHAYVHFVDYGTRKYVKKSSLRFLEQKFASTCRKSYKGRLYGVRPRYDDPLFSTDAVNFFKAKTSGRKFRATIMAYDKAEGYDLCLVESGILKLADIMVAEGLVDSTNANASKSFEFTANGVTG